jgi:PDZ domain
MGRFAWILMVSLSAALARAGEPAAGTTQPAGGDYSALIQQLGDPDSDVRDKASGQLLSAGADAADALKDAARHSPDPEIQSRAAGLLLKISGQESPPPQEQIVAGNGAAIIIVNGQIVAVGQGPIQINPQGDDLTQLSSNLEREMLDANLTDQQCKQVREQVQRVMRALKSMNAPANLPTNEADRQKLVDAYLSECDALRKQLADFKLPDPGAVLPPPATVRLGVELQTVITPAGEGLSIRSVEAKSRGQNLGLEPGDLIVVINGKAVPSIGDLRESVMSGKRLTVTIRRRGQEIELEEKPATK